MLFRRRPVFILILAIAGIVFGFIFLLKSCLAKYDERFIHSPLLVFNYKNGEEIVFTLVEFQRATSYSSQNGITHKSVSTSYYIQNGPDRQRKIKSHKQVKFQPVEVMGQSDSLAWVFIGEPMAFDPYSLELRADKKIIEMRNPLLKNLLPDELRFYEFDERRRLIHITTKDGARWDINTTTLEASEASPGSETSSEQKLELLNQSLSKIRELEDSFYKSRREKKLNSYSSEDLSRLRYARDSIYKLIRNIDQASRDEKEYERELESLRRTGLSFSQIKVNQDTSGSQWYGIYSESEWLKLDAGISKNVAWGSPERRYLFVAPLISRTENKLAFNKTDAKKQPEAFLDGGFLLNKSTALPLVWQGKRFIVFKNSIGNEGKIQVAAVKGDRILWKYDTGLTEWNDWRTGRAHLYITGTSNKALNSSEPNLVIKLDLQTGIGSGYDYFRQKEVP